MSIWEMDDFATTRCELALQYCASKICCNRFFGSSKLLEKLSSASFTLEELMLEDDFLQEAAGRHAGLIAL
jgi:hypothetical protein